MGYHLPLVQVSGFGPGFLGSSWDGPDGGNGTGQESGTTANGSVTVVLAIGDADHPFLVRASVNNKVHVDVSHVSGPGLGHTGFAIYGTVLNEFDPAATFDAPITIDTNEIHWNFTNYYTEAQSITINSIDPPYVDVVDYDITVGAPSPNSGGTLGGTIVTVNGGNFFTGATVTFGGVPATDVVVVNADTITCIAPAHVAGAVDIVVTNTDATFGTLVNGFTYVLAQSVPLINMGSIIFVNGPAPSSNLTNAAVTPGDNNGTLTYLWEQTAGPVLTPVISSPADVNTEVIFTEYSPGTYTFRLTVTTEDLGNGPIVATADATFIILPTRAPRVSNGTVQVQWDDPAEIIPITTDDGWGGALTETLTLVSGCGTPTMTHTGVFDPAVFDNVIFDVKRWELTNFPELTCVYLFKVTVTRDDALVGVGLWRVLVYLASDEEPAPLNDGPIMLLVNGEEAVDALVDSTNIDHSPNSNPTCSFQLYNEKLTIFNDVVIERGAKRLFGGVCLSQALKFNENNPFYLVNLVGYAWHLGRTRLTKSYLDTSISDIAINIAGFALGGLTTEFVQTGLPSISIDFIDQSLDQCLTSLVNQLPGSHWKVDDYNRLHLAIFEPSGDPFPLLPNVLRKYNIRNLRLNEDGGPVVNKVNVKHTTVTRTPLVIGSEVEVPTLDGYAPTGVASLGGNDVVFYTGLVRKAQHPIWGVVFLDFSQEEVSGGSMPATESAGYTLTLVTNVGETPLQVSRSALTITAGSAFRITLTSILGPAECISQVRGINVYRTLSNVGGFPIGGVLIGQLQPIVGSSLLDGRSGTDFIGTTPAPPPIVDTAEDVRNYLTGCSGYTATSVDGIETLNDVDAQLDTAVAMGKTLAADGVIEATIDGGNIDAAQANALGLDYLALAKTIRKSAQFITRDDDAKPGQVQSIVFPLYDFAEDLKVQSVQLQGFEKGVPHEYEITAARDAITVDDLLKKSPAINSN